MYHPPRLKLVASLFICLFDCLLICLVVDGLSMGYRHVVVDWAHDPRDVGVTSCQVHCTAPERLGDHHHNHHHHQHQQQHHHHHHPHLALLGPPPMLAGTPRIPLGSPRPRRAPSLRKSRRSKALDSRDAAESCRCYSRSPKPEEHCSYCCCCCWCCYCLVQGRRGLHGR